MIEWMNSQFAYELNRIGSGVVSKVGSWAMAAQARASPSSNQPLMHNVMASDGHAVPARNS